MKNENLKIIEEVNRDYSIKSQRKSHRSITQSRQDYAISNNEMEQPCSEYQKDLGWKERSIPWGKIFSEFSGLKNKIIKRR